MRTCYALRHVPFESLGLLEPLLQEKGFDVRLLDVPASGIPDVVRDAELVIVLGGPIGVYEEHLFPFLTDELRLLEGRLRERRATLGICLGAQLMARALGARVYPGAQKEMGWSQLKLASDSEPGLLSALEGKQVLHWHGDTFELPEGAKLLASTSITPHQAFTWEDVAIGLQFHLEVTARDLEAWYVGNCVELSCWGKMTIPELRAEGRRHAPVLAPYAIRTFSTILERCLSGAAVLA